MPQDSKTKFTDFIDADVYAASENAPAMGVRSSSLSFEKRKKQAEEPIYLTRI
jgi:hypothetical protein